MSSSFGTRLRRQREEQQIPLGTIAEQTKIKLSLLEGLERDDVSRWPSGIFRRSYFRAYARAIGLDPDSWLPEFQALHPDPDAEMDVTQVLAQARELGDQASRRPPTRLRCLIDSAVSAALHPQQGAKSGPSIPTPPPTPPRELTGVDLFPPETMAAASGPIPAARHDSNPARDETSSERYEGVSARYETNADRAPGRGRSVRDRTIPAGPQTLAARDETVSMRHETLPARNEAVAARPEPARSAPGVTLSIPPLAGMDFVALAHLCTKLARATGVCDVTPVLEETAGVMSAVGLTLWMGDPLGRELLPVFACGYPPEVSARLGRVSCDSDTAVASAFRTAQTRIVDGGDVATGAVVVPLQTSTGCVGVLAIELRDGGEHLQGVRAAASIVAAQLSMLVGAPVLAAEAVGV
jgi:hypothetical protein